MRLYLDSNIFISFVREEIDGAFNLRYKDAEIFFSYCIKHKIELVVSDLFFDEVKKIASLERQTTKEILGGLGIFFAATANAAENKAKEISQETGIHLSDAAHVATAIETNCVMIISWNKKDFEKTNNFIPCYSPSELVQNNP